ncbi:MAG: type VI secretion system ATPase TssH, partial [Actinomycetota bacterium]|nr:type VI secretion system ATPase TssH [Actinomycetota bacterium]
MQPDRFTVKSQEAVADAQRLAAAARNPEVAPAHLLVALLEQDEGLVPAVLGKLGADLTAIRSRARTAMSDLPRLGEGGQADPRPSSALAEVLRRAEGEMAGLGDEYVSTEHMLLAIADSSGSLAEILPDRE